MTTAETTHYYKLGELNADESGVYRGRLNLAGLEHEAACVHLDGIYLVLAKPHQPGWLQPHKNWFRGYLYNFTVCAKIEGERMTIVREWTEEAPMSLQALPRDPDKPKYKRKAKKKPKEKV